MSTLEIITIVLMLLFGLIGLISGLVKKIGKITAVVAGLVVAFLVASPINNAFTDTNFYKEEVVEWFGGSTSVASVISLIVMWLISFLIVYLFIRIIFRAIRSLIEKSRTLGTIDKILGLAFGVATGLVFGTAIIIVVAFIGGTFDSVNEWLITDIYDKGSAFVQWIYNTLVPMVYST